MTVIIAIEHPETGERAIAADGRVRTGDGIMSESTRKLVTMDGAVFGCSGQSVFLNILRSLEGQPWEGIHVFARKCRELIAGDEIRPKQHEDGGRPTYALSIVVVAGDGIWTVCEDLSYVEVQSGVPAAVGSGSSEAQGAALAILGFLNGDWPPGEVVVRAVEIACRLDASCGGEIALQVIPSQHKLKRAV